MDPESSQTNPVEPPTLERLIADLEQIYHDMDGAPRREDGWITANEYGETVKPPVCAEAARGRLAKMLQAGLVEKKVHRGKHYFRAKRNGTPIP